MDPEAIVKVRDCVEYFDQYGRSHLALVTAVHGVGDEKSSINCVYVVDDSAQTDSYGRQIERATSVVPEALQSAHGRFWRLLKQ